MNHRNETLLHLDNKRFGENELVRIRDTGLDTPCENTTIGDEEILEDSVSISTKNEANLSNDNKGSNEKSNDVKEYPTYRRRIKRGTISLYGNRPSYGFPNLHRDLWE